MDDTKKFEFTKNYVMRRIVDESILVPVSPSLKRRDTLVVLNPVAANFLEKIKSGKTTCDVFQELLAEFDVEPQILEDDLKQFVQSMMEAEVIREHARVD